MPKGKKHSKLKNLEASPPAIFDEVDTFEELAPRLQELSSKAPAGTRVYVRIRPKTDRGTVH